MTDLTFDQTNNIGGLYLVRFVPVVGVDTLPPIQNGYVNGSPTFKSGYRWFLLYGTLNSKGYDEAQSNSDNGPLWDVSIGAFLPGDLSQNRLTLAELANHRFLVECQDNCDTWRRIGTLTQTLEMTYKFSTGTGVGDRRGYTIAFKGSFTQPPALVSGIN